MMLELSDDAVEALRDIGALRLTAHEAADGEFDVEVQPAGEPAEGDSVVERDDVRVFLDATATGVLADQVLEIEPHGDHVHFGFSPQP
jgi:Fe-S cluster assembly iron-binding protein IscA